jgi:hypothetical protein
MKLNSVALAGLVVTLTGCHVVKPVQPAVYIPEHNPPVVWVTYTDNSFVPVAGPKIVGDSLMGTWQGLAEPIAISLTEIQTVQAKMPSPKKTILLATVLTATVGGAIYSIATAGTGGTTANCGATKGTMNNYCCEVEPGEKNQNGAC